MKSSTFSIIDFFKEKIVSNSIVYVAGNFIQKFIVFLLIPVYTYYLSPGDFGIIGLATTVEGILAILFGLGLRSSVARYYYDFSGDRERLKQYITSNFLFLILISFLVTWSIHLIGDSVWRTITSGQIAFNPYIEMVIWSAFSMIIINFSTTLYQTQQNAKGFVIAQLAIVLINLAFTIYFVVILRYGAQGQLLGRMISNGIMAVVLAILLLKDWFTCHLHPDDIKSSMIFGFPLVFHGLFAWALGSIDRIMLEPNIQLSELGFYNLGYQIGGVLTAFLVSINQAWVPYYYSIMQEDENNALGKINPIANLYIILFGFICLIGMLFSSEILSLISSPRYASAALYVPLILLAALFNGYYFMASTPIFYGKKTSWIPIMTGLSAALNIGLNLLWIPRYGALGSAWATLISYAVLAIIAYFLGKRLKPLDISLKWFCLLNILLLGCSYLMTYISMDQLVGWIIKIALIATYILVAYLGYIRNGRIILRKFILPNRY